MSGRSEAIWLARRKPVDRCQALISLLYTRVYIPSNELSMDAFDSRRDVP